ncbi:hypothetical protein SISSUDRAFT_1048087, partial [Sistotremastrum suecicum HHB10207 ss-3]
MQNPSSENPNTLPTASHEIQPHLSYTSPHLNRPRIVVERMAQGPLPVQTVASPNQSTALAPPESTSPTTTLVDSESLPQGSPLSDNLSASPQSSSLYHEPGLEFSSDQTNPYPAEPCAVPSEREIMMLDFTDEVMRPIILHGQILWHAVWKETGGHPMTFDDNETLLSPHSHVLEAGANIFKQFVTDISLLSQPPDIIERPESADLAAVTAALLDLLTSPEISGYLGGLVGLNLFFAKMKDRQEPSTRKLSQAFTAAFGWFARLHDGNLTIMEPFMKLVVEQGMKTLIAHGVF